MNHFGKRLKQLRNQASLNQAELGRLAGVTRASISLYEKRETAEKCRVHMLTSIAESLGVTVDYLVTGQESPSRISLEHLRFAVEQAREISPQADSDKTARLIKFIYSLKVGGVEPSRQVVAGFLSAL